MRYERKEDSLSLDAANKFCRYLGFDILLTRSSCSGTDDVFQFSNYIQYSELFH